MKIPKTIHAIITPWPLSRGIRTWCGIDCQDERIRGDLIGISPAAINCRQCITAMRQAYKTLGEWVPELHIPDADPHA